MSHKIVIVLVVLVLLAPQSATAKEGSKGTLFIPTIGLYKPIRFAPIINHQWDMSSIGLGVAHLEDTNWVTDNWGRVVIGGHTPGGFSNLIYLQPGDEIYIISKTFVATYVVARVHYQSPDEWEWTAPTAEPTLTLITCYDSDVHTAGMESRLIIDATRVSYKE